MLVSVLDLLIERGGFALVRKEDADHTVLCVFVSEAAHH